MKELIVTSKTDYIFDPETEKCYEYNTGKEVGYQTLNSNIIAIYPTLPYKLGKDYEEVLYTDYIEE